MIRVAPFFDSRCISVPQTLYILRYQLEARGQCIPPPRHVLPVSQSGCGSVIRIATKI